MIPSAVAAEVSEALRDFLRTGFQPSNAEMADVLKGFLQHPENLLKGPYLSLSLPFQRAPDGELFPEIPLEFVPYRHQRTAMERLRIPPGRSTVIATGTGSGKTECFLWPILDHCLRTAGQRGIKAIVVYPMNALATDQAGRIAGTIWRNPRLRGRVSAGLFIGGARGRYRETAMTESRVIADREAMLAHPPDILLTNYKMLDYLLVRPSDQRLWLANAPGTLRYLVVDELHTFDGAQGTDLACLIRRLRARLECGDELVCVGTSATLGGAGEDLLRYVRQVFQTDFEPDAVVGESRQDVREFLGDTLITGFLRPRKDLAALADPDRHDTPERWLNALHRLFFDSEIPGDFDADAWRVTLAERLREHSAFRNLLEVFWRRGPACSLDELLAELRRTLPVADEGEAELLLNGLIALISVARRRVPERAAVRPFLDVGLHLWVRELRRMVCRVSRPVPRNARPTGQGEGADDGSASPGGSADFPATCALGYSDDLGAESEGLHLPLVQCRECHITGWGTVLREAENRIEADLRVFYNRFFRQDPDVALLYPGRTVGDVRGERITVCDSCRRYSRSAGRGRCDGCGESGRLVPLFRPRTTERRSGRSVLSKRCPFCGARGGLIIFGARATSLLSVAIGQTYGSRQNDHPKAIAFSDNVQDAAHRAGFIAARTWWNGVRAAVARTIAESGPLSLADLAGVSRREPGQVVLRWSDPVLHPDAFDDDRFVAEFLAPDRHWLRDFVHLQREGALPAESNLPELVAERLRWDTLGELGYRSRIGRTVERTRVAAVGPDRERLERAVWTLHRRLREEVGSLREIELPTVRALLLGILWRMRVRGAIRSDLTARWLQAGARLWWLKRQLALPDFGPRSARPLFPTDDARGDGLEPVFGCPGRSRTWYRNWTEAMLRRPPLALARPGARVALTEALRELERVALVTRLPVGAGQAWALDPAHFIVTPYTALLRSASGARTLVIPEDDADLWLGLPCLDPFSGETWDKALRLPPTRFGDLYRAGPARRIVAAEHTALLTREERDGVQRRFTDPEARPWEPNLLSATPTLELGIDIGDLSTVVLCSVPPRPENYVQRTGRAGRWDGNAFALTLATGNPHDLYFYAEPGDMVAGRVSPPGVFLNASAVLERQLTAFCFDRWSASGIGEDAVPGKIGRVLDAVEGTRRARFPYTFMRFVEREKASLLDSFFAAFESDDLTRSTKDYLTSFLRGRGDGVRSLQERLFHHLRSAARERRSLRADVEQLRRRIRKLQRGPRDDATEEELRDLRRERGGLMAVLRKLNGQDTFNFLTDAGVLPNYAFPEEGIKLRSVIYRSLPDASGGEGADHFEHETYEYVRPAASALGEFAPENPFYAGGRRVKMERVDLRVSEIADWRLCRECPYTERESSTDRKTTCPRCGDAMWADSGQLRPMLELRLVHAFDPDRRTRILDLQDAREPVFYTRDMVPDIAPEDVERAFVVRSADVGFGFEYVASATFRDINFGPVDEGAEPSTFAGRKRSRPGFQVCRKCGSVQSRRPGDEPNHARTCRLRGKPLEEQEEHITDCLYLYRDLRSEALRILLPVADQPLDSRVVSFVAALELGLRLRFRGQIEHLRVMQADYPAPDGGPRRGCLVLYDTVPGGTGYLKELVTEAEKLVSVFELALEALRDCSCASDPEKDGCYRCLFAYRRSRDMARTSRAAAMAVLEAILKHRDEFEEVPGLHAVKFGGLVESELEARFLDALRSTRLGAEPVRLRRELIEGRPGFVLRAGDRTWYVEPQVAMGPSEGVAIPSQPDFRIRSARAPSDQPDVLVFLDGFEYHEDRTAEDSAKRMALIRAGFVVWSLTWQDLDEAFGGRADASDFFAAPDPNPMASLQRRLDESWNTAALRTRFGDSSFRLLGEWLANPDREAWKRGAFTTLLALFDRANLLTAALRTDFESTTAALPAVIRERVAPLPPDVFVGGRGRWRSGGGPLDLFLALPPAAMQAADPDQLTAALHLHDDPSSRGAGDYRRDWNAALRAVNLLQFLPGGFWTTQFGLQEQAYASLGGSEPGVAAPEVSEAWNEVFELADETAAPFLRELASRGTVPPEIGYELAGSRGAVTAEAEAAWPAHRVALLLADGESAAPAFRDAGWTVVPGFDPGRLDEVLAVLPQEA